MRNDSPMFRHPGEGRGPACRAQSWIPAFAGMTAVFVMFAPMSSALAFDCAKAKTAVELAICDDPAAKRLDDELGAAYAALKESLEAADQKMLAKSQKRWIARREYCSEGEDEITACVKERTAGRLALLAGEPLSGPGLEARIVPQVLVQDGTPGTWDIDIAVLRFAEPKTPGEELLNGVAEEVLATAPLGTQEDADQSARLAREETFSLTYASPAFLSVRHSFYVNEGGAHGNSGVKNYNIDMARGEILRVDDVLPEPSAAILTLWCKTQIEAEKRRRVPDIDLTEDAAARDETIALGIRELSAWSISEEEIVVSFDPYAVGAYAEGSYECRFPTKGVKELALPGAVLP
jgi:uncharacterized protein YecT (DUF1311 family)